MLHIFDSTAQESVSIADTTLIGTAVVEGKRFNEQQAFLSGRNFAILEGKDLVQLPAQTLNEALQFVSGIDLRERGPLGAQADISLQGSGFEQVLLLINGIPMRDPQTAHHLLNLPVDFDRIDRIEILKGSAGRIYGANALAGAINIVLKKTAPGETTAEVFGAAADGYEQIGNEGYFAAGARASAGFGIGGSRHQLSLSALRSNGYRYNSANYQRRISYQANIGLGKSGSMEVLAGTALNNFGANSFYAYPGDKDAIEGVNTSMAALQAHLISGNWYIRPLAYWRYNEDHYIFRAYNPSFYQNFHYSTAWGGELHASRDLGATRLGAGLEYRTEIIRSTNLGDHERSFINAYLEDRFSFLNGGVLTAGVNLQYNDKQGVTLFPGVEVFYPISENSGIFSNVGMGNRLPSYTELYYTDSKNDNNDSLSAERSDYVELGLRKKGILSFSISGFQRRVNDNIQYTRSADTLKWTPGNISRTAHRGVECSLAWRQYEWMAISATYTLLDAEFSSGGDQFSKYSLDHARHRLVGQVLVKPGKKWSNSFNLRFTERFAGDDFTLVDYRFRYELSESASFTFDVSNIFDRFYIDRGFIEMPGRWFRAGLRFVPSKK
jgi:iron complex outermembrane receptor protein